MTLSQQFYAIALDKARAHKKVTDSSDDKWLLSSALLDAEATIDSLRRERDGLRARAETAEMERSDLADDNMSLNQAYHERNAARARAESAEAENARLREALKPYWHVVRDETA